MTGDGDRNGTDAPLSFAPDTGSCNVSTTGWVNVSANALNPSNNFHNSTISYLGALGIYGGGTCNPSFKNTLGLGIGTFAANDFLGAGATNSVQNACARIRTISVDGIYAISLFTVIDIHVPEIDGANTKTQSNITRPSLTDQA